MMPVTECDALPKERLDAEPNPDHRRAARSDHPAHPGRLRRDALGLSLRSRAARWASRCGTSRPGNDFGYNATEIFPTASTLKVPLIYVLYRLAGAGEIDLKERVTLSYANRVPGSGVLQHMDEGLQPTLRDLAELMIIVSDNWATDLLWNRLTKATVDATLAEIGMTPDLAALHHLRALRDAGRSRSHRARDHLRLPEDLSQGLRSQTGQPGHGLRRAQ